MVKFEVPAVVGIPEIVVVFTMLEVPNVRPSGRVPEATDHVYGAVPPDSVRVCAYETLVVATGRDDGVMEVRAPALIPKLYVLRSKKTEPSEKLSSASMVAIVVVAVVGVPEITPVVVLRERPGGREPEKIENV